MTYLLLYINFSRYKLAIFTKICAYSLKFYLKEHLLNILYLNRLWYDLTVLSSLI